jgi:flagellar biosynthesis protein FlhF
VEATKFEAISMREAIKKVKEELGRDAVIVSTREKDKALSPGGKPQKIIEVLATPAATTTHPSKAFRAGGRPTNGTISKAVFPKIETREKAVIVRSQSTPEKNTMASPHKRPQTPQAAKDQQGYAADGVANASSRALEDVQRQLQTQIEQLKSELRSLPQVNLGEQVQEMKVILHDILRSQQNTGSQEQRLPSGIEDIAIRLRAAGVLPSIISELTSYLLQQIPNASSDPARAQEEFLAGTIRFILKEIRVAVQSFGQSGTQEVHALIGPSGCGKTTTLAKIASHLSVTKGLRVALVSMDSMKVGASDQLRVYSKILGVEFFDARDPEDLEALVQKNYQYDVLLIDTIGRPASSKAQHDFLRSLRSQNLPIKFHIILPATMKNRDMEETVRAYQFVNPASVVFSKLDESWAFGEIFNIASLFQIPLSYFATGSQVPEDIESATKERVIERILRI